MKLADLKDLFKKASKSVSTSAIVVSLDPLSHIPSSSSRSSKAPENTEDDPDDSELADEGDTQVEHSSD